MHPLATILIPTFNRAHFVGEAIASALRQTVSEIEVLVLDDASTDGTSAVVAEFTDPRIRYLRHERNLGIAENWKRGITEVRADYFCLLHDDDSYEPRFVEELVKRLRNDSAAVLAFCDHWVMNAQGQRSVQASDQSTAGFKRHTLADGVLGDFARTALLDHSIPAGAALYRRRLVGPDCVDARARGSIDMWLLYRGWQTGGHAWFVPERLMNYRQHAQGMSRSRPFEMIEGHLFRFSQMLADPALKHLRDGLRRQQAEALEWYGSALLRTGRVKESRGAFRQALAARWTWKAMVGWMLSGCNGWGTSCFRAAQSWRERQRQRNSED